MSERLLLLLLAAGLVGCATAPAPESARPDALAPAFFAHVLTADPDGGARETRVIFVVLDEAFVLRTRETRWMANIRRDPTLRLRIGGTEVPVVASIIDDEAEESSIDTAFREKYGLLDRFGDWIRPDERIVLRLVPAPKSSSGGSRASAS